MTVFGAQYARAYDALYAGKDYASEVATIERLIDATPGTPGSILDLGCGTGNHALPLAARGHRVVGVDRAAEMISRARDKARGMGPNAPRFHVDDIRSLDLNQSFDAAIMMFAVLGYQYENADLSGTLRSVRRHLAPGGRFVFDVWNGIAVLAQGPGSRTAHAQDGPTAIVRRSHSELDPMRQVCRVKFTIERQTPGRAPEACEELHVMRFFFPQELGLALELCGLKLRGLFRFPEADLPPDAQSWNMIAVAEAV